MRRPRWASLTSSNLDQLSASCQEDSDSQDCWAEFRDLDCQDSMVAFLDFDYLGCSLAN